MGMIPGVGNMGHVGHGFSEGPSDYRNSAYVFRKQVIIEDM